MLTGARAERSCPSLKIEEPLMSPGLDVRSQPIADQVLEQLMVGVVVLDRDDRIIFINTSAQALFAASERQLLGSSLADSMSDDSILIDSIAQVRHHQGALTRREVVIELAGHPATVDISITPISHDALIIELQSLDRRLRIDRERRLIADNQAVRQLVRGLAHEVKNPLGGLRGAAQLLERQLSDDGLREYTDIIIGEADRLRTLVDDLLGPTVALRKRRSNIHEILERVRQLIEAEAADGITLVRDYDPSIPDMLAEPNRLIQAALNIVRNAMHALGHQGTITLRTRTQRHFTIGDCKHRFVVRVDICDNGPGVPVALMDSIFFPMVSANPAGSGLGLAIAQGLVHEQGGLIEFRSEPGNTVFTIWLPLEPVNDTSGHDTGR